MPWASGPACRRSRWGSGRSSAARWSRRSWRWLFWINLPFCLLAVGLVVAATPEQRDETSGHRVDVPGVVTIGLGLAAVVLALVQGQVWGWTSAVTLGIFGAGVALLVAWFVEHRVAAPTVDFSLFRNGPYFGASAADSASSGVTGR